MVVILALDKEMIEVFQTEANGLLAELRTIIEKLEQTKDSLPKELLQEFANKTEKNLRLRASQS
jgi:GTP-dependent phosphoenolpyruvate carboxykinase